jgi:hypothetical protein
VRVCVWKYNNSENETHSLLEMASLRQTRIRMRPMQEHTTKLGLPLPHAANHRPCQPNEAHRGLSRLCKSCEAVRAVVIPIRIPRARKLSSLVGSLRPF